MNMSYCRFQNTLLALRDCYNNLDNTDLSKEEHEARKALAHLCQKIVDSEDSIPSDEEINKE